MTAAPRYGAVAILLHWAIALAIVANLALGFWMHEAIEHGQAQARVIAAFQLHKSLGLTVLALSLLRLGWRLLHRPPPLPETVPAWGRIAAHVTHWALYGAMVALPLSGWLYVSAQWRDSAPLNVPTIWFGLFEVPHLLGLDATPPGTRQAAAFNALTAHWALAWTMVGLLVLHVAAALKHQFLDRDEVLGRMLPILARGPEHEPGRRALLAAGTVAILAAAIAFGAAVLRDPRAAPAAAIATVESAGPASGRAVTGRWEVLPQASEIAFTGTHAGVAFRGRFTSWSADIRFHPDRPTEASVAATVQTASATDGVPLHDETLPEREWFDVEHHPTAFYRSTVVRPLPGGAFEVDGTLTIKDRTFPVAALQLRVENGRLTIDGKATVRRSEANLGMESDPGADYVSEEIGVEVRVVADPR